MSTQTELSERWHWLTLLQMGGAKVTYCRQSAMWPQKGQAQTSLQMRVIMTDDVGNTPCVRYSGEALLI